VILWFVSTIVHAQQHQDGYIYQDWLLKDPAWNLDSPLRVDRISNSYFVATTINFEQSPNGDDGAYVGIQQRTSKTDRIAIFSIWNASAAKPALRCRDFGGEGDGKQCTIDFDFYTSRWYTLRVWRLDVSQDGQWWGAWIIDDQGQETWIGSIAAPLGTGDIARSSTFLEYYGPPRPCDNLKPATVVARRPFFNNRSAEAKKNGSTIGVRADGVVILNDTTAESVITMGVGEI
jgi:hypothetical protein